MKVNGKLTCLTVLGFIVICCLSACSSVNPYRPQDVVGPTSWAGGNEPREICVIMGISSTDDLELLYQDMPSDSIVYGMGTLFSEWSDNDFSTKVPLCTWAEIDDLEISRLVSVGLLYTVALYCDGRVITEEIKILDSLLWNSQYTGSPASIPATKPWGHLWATFSIERDNESNEIYLYRGEDNRNLMASCRLLYTGISNTIPPGIDPPDPASPDNPVRFKSATLTYGQSVLAHWMPAEGGYALWFRTLCTAPPDSEMYYFEVTEENADPLWRKWGISANNFELHYLYQVSVMWYVLQFGTNSDGTINQKPDNRTAQTG